MRDKVLITGAAGRIGSRLIAYLKDDYDLVLTDKEVSSLSDWQSDSITVQTLDILNKEECLSCCSGVDMVVHLAGNPSPLASYEEVKTINMDGTFTIMSAASEKGCRRLIYASSIHAVKGYEEDVQVKTDSVVRPPDFYGVTKVFGEALGSYFAYQESLEVIAIRIGGYRSLEMLVEKGEELTMDQRDSYLSERDMGHLIDRCLKADLDEPFLIVHGLSDNHFKFLDLSDTKRKLAYNPQDDGFEFKES